MNQRKAGMMLSYAHIIISNTISLIYTPFMLRMMGQSEYGLYGTANSFVSYLSILSFGIAGAYIRFNAQARAKGDREEEKRLNGMFLTIFSVLAICVLIGGLILIVVSGSLVKQSFTPDELFKLRVLIFILTTSMMVSFISNVFMMALQAYEQFIFLRVTLLLVAIIQPFVNIILLKNGGRAVAITLASCIIGTLSYLVFFIYARKVIQFEVCFHGFEKKEFKELFVFSGYLFLNSITEQITFSTDNIILSSIWGTSAVAVYTVGASFKGYFQNFSSSISSVFAPQVNMIVANHGSTKELDEIFTKIGRVQFYVVSLILIGYVSIGHAFVNLWAGQDYSDGYYIGLLLMLAVFIPAFQNIGIQIQQAMNMHKARSIVYFLVAVLNVGLTIPLSMKWSGIGAALSTTICMFIGTGIFMNWYYTAKIKLDMIGFWKSIASILPGFVLPIATGIVIRKYCTINSYAHILLSAIIIVVVYVASIWMFSMNAYEKNLFYNAIRRIKGK